MKNYLKICLDSLYRVASEPDVQLDPEFSEDVELAWRVVLAPGIAYMTFRYRRS